MSTSPATDLPKQHTQEHLPWPVSILTDIAYFTLVRMRKDRRVSRRFQAALGRRSHGAAVLGDGSTMQDCE